MITHRHEIIWAVTCLACLSVGTARAADEPATFYSDLTPAAFTPTDGPLTNAMNLRVRTDSNGYLLATVGTYGGADGPLTTFGNLRLRTDSNGYLLVGLPAGAGAPTDATYITKTANATLSAEFAMGSLATGIVKNTTTTGTPSIAAAGTDYQAPITCADTGVVFASAANTVGCDITKLAFDDSTNLLSTAAVNVSGANATSLTPAMNIGSANGAIMLNVGATSGQLSGSPLVLFYAESNNVATDVSVTSLSVGATNLPGGAAMNVTGAEISGYAQKDAAVLTGLSVLAFSQNASATTTLYGAKIEADIGGTGTATDLFGLNVIADVRGGTVTNVYGINVADVSGATIANYAIKTGTGLISFGDSVQLANGKALKSDTTTAHTWLMQAYDTDTGPGYVTFGTFTNGAAPSLVIAPPAGGATVSVKGRYIAAGAIPAVSDTSANSCGTGTETIAANSSDNAGKVTVIGSAGTSCTVTFATAWTNEPSCFVTNETTANLARATSTTTTVILAGVFAQNDVLAYGCFGR